MDALTEDTNPTVRLNPRMCSRRTNRLYRRFGRKVPSSWAKKMSHAASTTYRFATVPLRHDRNHRHNPSPNFRHATFTGTLVLPRHLDYVFSVAWKISAISLYVTDDLENLRPGPGRCNMIWRNQERGVLSDMVTTFGRPDGNFCIFQS